MTTRSGVLAVCCGPGGTNIGWVTYVLLPTTRPDQMLPLCPRYASRENVVGGVEEKDEASINHVAIPGNERKKRIKTRPDISVTILLPYLKGGI